MPSHLKAVLDRTILLVKMRMVEESDGTVHHEALVDFSRIHTLVICGCGFPDWDGNFDAMKLMCKTCFGDPEIVCVPKHLFLISQRQLWLQIRFLRALKQRVKSMRIA